MSDVAPVPQMPLNRSKNTALQVGQRGLLLILMHMSEGPHFLDDPGGLVGSQCPENEGQNDEQNDQTLTKSLQNKHQTKISIIMSLKSWDGTKTVFFKLIFQND